jgi:hypothetical protein
MVLPSFLPLPPSIEMSSMNTAVEPSISVMWLMLMYIDVPAKSSRGISYFS